MDSVRIGDKEYKLRYSLRTMRIYQSITHNRNFAPLEEELLILYSCILAADDKCGLDYDAFADALDADMSKLKELREWLAPQTKAFLTAYEGDSGESDKKKV